MSDADFLRSIVTDPEDIGTRLAYADWLDERGDARGEFIRLQIELADKWPNITCLCGSSGFEGQFSYECRGCPPMVLRRRERELFHPLGRSLAGGAAAEMALRLDQHKSSTSGGIEGTVRCGFVEEVHCRLADWYGERCERCRGRGFIGITSAECDECKSCGGSYGKAGFGRIGGHGPAIVAAQPIRTVRLTDREPWRSITGEDWWIREGDGTTIADAHRAVLPRPIYDLLIGGRESNSHGRCRAYSGTGAPQADALLALIRWARQQAGLESVR